MTYTRTTVGIDDYYPALPALVSNRRWNGWAIPFFTLDTVRVLAELLERDRQDDDDPYVTITGDEVRLVQPRAQGEYLNYGEWHAGQVVEPTMIDGVAHYSVGGMDWCWHELDETDEED